MSSKGIVMKGGMGRCVSEGEGGGGVGSRACLTPDYLTCEN